MDRSIEEAHFQEAGELWDVLCARHLLPYSPAKPDSLVNGDFGLPVLGRGFDWRLSGTGCAVAAETRVDTQALELFLPGNRPEACEIAHQFLRLESSVLYVMRFQYRTSELPNPTGLSWSITGGQPYEFRSSPEWTDGEWRWTANKAADRLVLGYHREAGSTRHEGTVFIRQVRLERSRDK